MKNLLLTAVIAAAASTSALAQLYVSPNGATSDSFIYAKGVHVYVDGTIQLEENTNNADTAASFYLRDEAQLIQGDGVGNDANSGNGYISVYQEALGDQYDYSAWTSPVSATTATGNQNFGEDRLFAENGLTASNPASFIGGYNGNSSPGVLNIADFWFFRWNIAGQNFLRIGTTDDVAPGQGFIMKGTNDPTGAGVPETNVQRYDFRGRPNSGDITVTLPSSNLVSGEFEQGNILVGNPYPSALDLNLFYYDTANNGPTGSNNKFSMIFYNDEDRTIESHNHVDNKSGYGTWIPLGSQPDLAVGPYNPGEYTVPQFQNFDGSGNPIDPVDPDGNPATDGTNPFHYGPDVDRRMAPVGQGFFIQSINTVADDNITFKNAHRRFIKESDAIYNSEFRSSEGGSTIGGPQIDPIDPQPAFSTPKIRINTYMGVSHMRQTVLILNDAASDGFDNGWDAMSPMDATSEMYFPIMTPFDPVNTIPFVINSVRYTNNSKKIPFTLQLEENMNVVITGVEEIDLPVDNVYVWDSLNDTYQNITGGDSAGFFVEEGTHIDRFYIVFHKPSTVDEEYIRGRGNEGTTEETTSVSFFQNNQQTRLEVGNPDAMEITTAAIFDMRGRLVLNQQNLGNASRFTFNTGTFSDGTYIVILTTADNQTIDYKIIVENK